ncbi:hypothetical protein ACFFIS_06615 [Virgibacillus soli]|uniref:Uncharacterized protein n=1 Tax=Paracerasibacillus soli TaxID=480284 RepID=A0ABU5CVE4_9BACI|nr:hypothetical protein [Virgibacillus soli]MDY0409373.1 hypothetical protein [Virgibacillus soli]
MRVVEDSPSMVEDSHSMVEVTGSVVEVILSEAVNPLVPNV